MSKGNGTRADAAFLALVWRPGGLRLVELPLAGAPAGHMVERWRGKAPGAFGPGRHHLGLWRASQTLVVRFPGDPRVPALLSSDGGYTFAPVPPVPSFSPHLGGCQAHRDGSITVLEGAGIPDVQTGPQTLYRLPEGAERWDGVELPEPFSARSVSLLPSGEPLLGGCQRAPDGVRSALLRLTPDGPRVIVPPSVRSPRWVWWLRGFLNEDIDEPFIAVDAADEPWILLQVHGPLESPHALLSLVSGNGGQWRSVRRGASVWLRPRPGAVRFVTSDGKLRDSADGGRSWTGHDLMPAVRRLSRLPTGCDARVCAGAQRGDDLALVLTVEDPSRPALEQLRQTLVIHTADGGRTIRELLRTDDPEEAVVAIVAPPLPGLDRDHR